MTQASSACSGTWLWAKTVARCGSIPAATSWAYDERVRARSVSGSTGTVMACRSTTM